MIGFPLQLPIEATAPREFTLAGNQVMVNVHEAGAIRRDLSHRITITVTKTEAAALRDWLWCRSLPSAQTGGAA